MHRDADELRAGKIGKVVNGLRLVRRDITQHVRASAVGAFEVTQNKLVRHGIEIERSVRLRIVAEQVAEERASDAAEEGTDESAERAAEVGTDHAADGGPDLFADRPFGIMRHRDVRGERAAEIARDRAFELQEYRAGIEAAEHRVRHAVNGCPGHDAIRIGDELRRDGSAGGLEQAALEAMQVERVGELRHQQRGDRADRAARQRADAAAAAQLAERIVDDGVDREARARKQRVADLLADRADHGAGRELSGQRIASELAAEIRAEHRADIAGGELPASRGGGTDRAVVADHDLVGEAVGMDADDLAVPVVEIGGIGGRLDADAVGKIELNRSVHRAVRDDGRIVSRRRERPKRVERDDNLVGVWIERG